MEVSAEEIAQPRPAVEFSCHLCGKTITICKSCWRNDRYCSDECSNKAARAVNRKKQKKYSLTDAGKLSQGKRQRAYRAGKKTKQNTDHPPKIPDDYEITKQMPASTIVACAICGKSTFVIAVIQAWEWLSLRRVYGEHQAADSGP